MLYVESPIGVGFSYSNTSSDYFWNDTRTGMPHFLGEKLPCSTPCLVSKVEPNDFLLVAAEDNLRFVINWLEEFPNYKDSELFLTGESYAGISKLVWCFLQQYQNRRILKI